jgi:hypothetical protein
MRGCDGREADRDVDVEHRPPPEAGRQRTADRRADRERRPDRRAVDRERTRPLTGIGERVREQGEGGGEEDGAAEPLHGASGVEHADAADDGAPEGRAREEDEAAGEDPPAPEAVGDRAGGEDDGGERERVRVHDPLQAGDAGVEAGRDLRQRRVDDGDVEHEHRRREADDGESSAAIEHRRPFRWRGHRRSVLAGAPRGAVESPCVSGYG